MHNQISQYLQPINGLLVHVCCNKNTPPSGAYQVNFHRLEIILEGQCNTIVDSQQGHKKLALKKNDMIYIPSKAWSKPTWEQSCKMISILLSQHQIGFSFVNFTTEQGFVDVSKHAISRPNSPVFEHTIDALNCFNDDKCGFIMGEYLVKSILSFCQEQLENPKWLKTRRSEKLYHNICAYVQENYQGNISRLSVANRFGISTSHVSRIFNQEGAVSYADYVNYVRLERAKFILKKYNFKLEEISRRCGFKDTNYFCRIFKHKTGKTPSEYRISCI